MNKARINAIIDILMLVFFIPCVYSVIAMEFIITGRLRAGGKEFLTIQNSHLGISLGTWKDIHAWTGWIFIVLVILHIFMHFKWLISIPKFFKKQQS